LFFGGSLGLLALRNVRPIAKGVLEGAEQVRENKRNLHGKGERVPPKNHAKRYDTKYESEQ
jgi:hypothetical protein